jgi:allantoinase
MRELVVRGTRVVTPDGIRPASIHIRDGAIAEITSLESAQKAITTIDAGDSVVMPGVVDTHVHINEPGRTEWEGFETATKAAAAGGVTSLVEMPLNSIPATTSSAALQTKLAAAHGKLWVDVGFWGGVVPGNSDELSPIFDSGAWGFKSFLIPSGVDEFANVTEVDLRAAMPVLARIDAPLLVHAELPGPINDASAALNGLSPNKYSTWLASRPPRAENEAIALMISLAREFGVHVHIVHLSSSGAIEMIRDAKRAGVRITVETCPHYLTFAAEEIPDRAVEFKCAPPIRECENREQLWQALADGTIDFVASDHSPAPPALKCAGTGDFLCAWGGISSLQLSLPVLWTHAKLRGYALEQLCKWVCRGPAAFARLKRKGEICVGCDADFVIWNPEERFTVDASRLFHRHKLTPYANHTLCGVVKMTILRGQIVYENGAVRSDPKGRVMLRGQV